MKKLIIVFIASLVLFGFSSCRRYVEIDQVGVRILKYTSDYQNLLNEINRVNRSFYYPLLASDDIYITDEAFLNRMTDDQARAYTWRDAIVAENVEDNEWSNLYQQIYLFNEIITNVMNSEDGSEEQKRNILAQAKVHRAINYFYLVNIYAKQYDPATASSDLGVPLLTTPDLFASLDRKPVQAIYDQILSDLTNAVPDLPARPDINILASKPAATGILARIYLQMGDYDKALQYAEETLAFQNGLVDLNTYAVNTNAYPTILDDPEEIWIKTLFNEYPTVSLNPELTDLFDDGDIRGTLFIVNGDQFGSWNIFQGKGYFKHQRIILSGKVTNGPTVPEMMLIRAESIARQNGSVTDVLDVLNTLRKKRYLPANYTDLTAASIDEALALTLVERRKELMVKGLRWFDQKRFVAIDGTFPTQTRTYKGETYTLEANSPRYVFPIAIKYILLNPEIEQNPR